VGILQRRDGRFVRDFSGKNFCWCDAVVDTAEISCERLHVGAEGRKVLVVAGRYERQAAAAGRCSVGSAAHMA